MYLFWFFCSFLKAFKQGSLPVLCVQLLCPIAAPTLRAVGVWWSWSYKGSLLTCVLQHRLGFMSLLCCVPPSLGTISCLVSCLSSHLLSGDSGISCHRALEDTATLLWQQGLCQCTGEEESEEVNTHPPQLHQVLLLVCFFCRTKLICDSLWFI